MLGTAPAEVVPVRLDPDLKQAMEAHAEAEHTTTSEIIREALRRLAVLWEPDEPATCSTSSRTSAAVVRFSAVACVSSRRVASARTRSDSTSAIH